MNHQKATGKETARATSGWQRLKGARAPEPGLHIVATPIGALADITLRALDTLAGADLIACEDTRTTRVLLDAYGISARLMAYHEHNADKAGPQILAALDDSAVVALVSDAGTPLLSDPGYRLVEEVLKSGHKVVPVPGASALLAALVGSGLPTDGIYFAGFLPPKSAARRARLEALGETPATLVLYEAPHRIGEALADCAAVFGPERRAVLARELTKTFEEFRRGPLSALIEAQEDDPARGEIVLLIAPPETQETSAETVDALLQEAVARLGPSKGAAEVARAVGQSKRALYQRALELAGKAPDR